jgi:osmoprotectant transport system ATP-binding protein
MDSAPPPRYIGRRKTAPAHREQQVMIVLEQVSKSYDGGKHFVVDNVSLQVPADHLLVLLGGSGSGKTTLLKMINRLVEPSAGRLLIGGRDIRTLDPVQLRRGIGYVIQGSGLFPHLSVADNIALVPRLLHWPAARIAQRVEELLELVQLPPAQYRHRRPGQLSGGQQQRVGFARALAAGPQVMLLDEPFGALDPLTRDELRGQLLAIRRSLGLTAVMVTHDMTEALLSADRIAVLNAGRLLRVGSPRELLADPGDPFVAALLSSPRHQAEQLESLLAGARA